MDKQEIIMDKQEIHEQLKSENERLQDLVRELQVRLSAGRYYLMSVNADEITVENTLEAFGWTP
jgi:hypothetical protein